MNDWKVLAPPTDHELRERGLGFSWQPPSTVHRDADGDIIVPHSPRPPSIVAAELDAKMIAYKKGLTPRREGIAPPNEVLLAVDMARAGFDSIRRPAPLDMSLQPEINKDANGRNEVSNKDNSTNYVKQQRIPNSYSMGTTIPSGVKWRYVDVLNTSIEISKKKSPSKSPRHRLSTNAATSTKSGTSFKNIDAEKNKLGNNSYGYIRKASV